MMGNKYQYFSVEMSVDPEIAFIKRLAGIGKPYLLKKGVLLANVIPRNLVFDVDKNQGVVLTDFLNNISSNIFISERAKSLFNNQGLGEGEVEYLPFLINNQDGRLETNHPYYIVNILSIISCLNLDKAEYALHPSKGTVWRISKIEIDESKTQDEKIFRLGEDPTIVIIRSDLVESIKKEKLTGLELCPVGKRLP